MKQNFKLFFYTLLIQLPFAFLQLSSSSTVFLFTSFFQINELDNTIVLTPCFKKCGQREQVFFFPDVPVQNRTCVVEKKNKHLTQSWSCVNAFSKSCLSAEKKTSLFNFCLFIFKRSFLAHAARNAMVLLEI